MLDIFSISRILNKGPIHISLNRCLFLLLFYLNSLLMINFACLFRLYMAWRIIALLLSFIKVGSVRTCSTILEGLSSASRFISPSLLSFDLKRQKLSVFQSKLQRLKFLEFLDKREDEKNNWFNIKKKSGVCTNAVLIYLMTSKYIKFIRSGDYYNNRYSSQDIAQWGNGFFYMIYICLNWYIPIIFIDQFQVTLNIL